MKGLRRILSINRVKLWLIVLLSELNYRLLLHRRNFLCRWLSNHRWWGFDGLDGKFEVVICDRKTKVDGGDVPKSGGVTTAFPARPSSELQRIMSRVSSE